MFEWNLSVIKLVKIRKIQGVGARIEAFHFDQMDLERVVTTDVNG